MPRNDISSADVPAEGPLDIRQLELQTTQAGVRNAHDQDTDRADVRGPALLEDFLLREQRNLVTLAGGFDDAAEAAIACG